MIILTMCFSSPALFITTLERFCLWESKQDESECSSAQNYEAQNAAKLLRLVPAWQGSGSITGYEQWE